MNDEVPDHLSNNQAAWDEVAPVYARKNQDRLISAFQDAKFVCLDSAVLALMQKILLQGKNVAQLCCNNGRETISMKRLGLLLRHFEERSEDVSGVFSALEGASVKPPLSFTMVLEKPC